MVRPAISSVIRCMVSRRSTGPPEIASSLAIVSSVAAIIRLGGWAVDEENSARPVAVTLAQSESVAGTLPIAVFEVPRQTEYGLAFYRNQIVQSYDRGEIPVGAHLLVTKEGAQSDLAKVVGSRVVTPIGSSSAQHLEYYRVSGAAVLP